VVNASFGNFLSILHTCGKGDLTILVKKKVPRSVEVKILAVDVRPPSTKVVLLLGSNLGTGLLHELQRVPVVFEKRLLLEEGAKRLNTILTSELERRAAGVKNNLLNGS